MNLNHSFTKMFKSSFKDKVRITAGLIVAMLITGNVAMATGPTSGYTIPVDVNGYISGDLNINVENKDITFNTDILDPDTGVSSQSTLIEASNFSRGIHQEVTINISENIGVLSEGEIFVGLNLGSSGSLYNCCNNFTVTSSNGADVIGIYHSGYSTEYTGDTNEEYSNHNSNIMSISTEGHGIAYYYSDGGSLDNSGTINADTAIIMTSVENNNTLTNSGTINGDVLMDTSGTNTLTVSSGEINGDITFSGGGDNYLTYSNVNVVGTGDIYGDDTGYNEITVSGGYSIAKDIYDFNLLKVSGGGFATLSEGYEISMNSEESYTPSSGTATGLIIEGTLTLNTELSGSEILVPKIETYGGDITVSETGKIKFYVSGSGTESSYDVIFGGTLSTVNVASDGNLVASDGTLEYNDELFVETLGWNVTNISESDTQTVVTLSNKNVYDELRETTEDNNRTQIINILDDDQDILGIHEVLSNVSMDDAETAVSELSGDIYSSLSDGHIKTNKMFTGKVNSMMSSPLTLRGERQSDFALLLENSTAELSSDTFTQAPNYSFLEGEEKYIQHFDILGTTGSNDKTGVEYDTHGSGFVGITERIMGNNSSLGLSYGYYDSRNDYDDGSDSEAESFYLGMTHKLYFGKDYMLASYFGTEYSKNDVTREITTLDLQANSDYDSYSVSIGTDLSKNIKLSERVTMVPSIGVGYSRIERESFTESGSIGSAALDVESMGLDSVTSEIGLRIDVDITDKLVWCVGGSWEHEYGDLNKDQEASFVGDVDSEIFEIEGANIDEDTYSILTGFNYNVNDSLTYRIMYSFTQQDDLGENNIDLGVSWKF